MEDLTYHAKVLKVNENGSILVQPIVFKEEDYQDEMLLHTGYTKMYDRFGNKLDAKSLRKDQWIKFITGPQMTMSLPPQLNPTVLYEHIPMLQFKAEVLKIKDKISVKVVDDYGSFAHGKLKLNFFDKPVLFNEDNEALKISDLEEGDTLDICAIVSFFTHLPLIEIYRAEVVS